jgi:hypothetical protein
MKKLLVLVAVCLGLTLITGSVLAKPPTDRGSSVEKSMGQTLFLPAIHKDLSYERGVEQQEEVIQIFTTRILIRNADTKNAIRLTSIVLYDENGDELHEWIDEEALIDESVTVGPRASTTYGIPAYIVPNDPSIKGRHSVFLKWQADDYVIHPAISAGFHSKVYDGNGAVLNSLMNMESRIIE